MPRIDVAEATKFSTSRGQAVPSAASGDVAPLRSILRAEFLAYAAVVCINYLTSGSNSYFNSMDNGVLGLLPSASWTAFPKSSNSLPLRT